MSVRTLNYGQRSGHTWFVVLLAGAFAVGLIGSLFFEAGEGPQLQVVPLHEPWDWIVAATALLFLGLAVLGLREATSAGNNRRSTLALTSPGIDYQPKGRFGRSVFIAYCAVKAAAVVSEDGSQEFRIKHSGGHATFPLSGSDDRASFEGIVASVREQSGQHRNPLWYF